MIKELNLMARKPFRVCVALIAVYSAFVLALTLVVIIADGLDEALALIAIGAMFIAIPAVLILSVAAGLIWAIAPEYKG